MFFYTTIGTLERNGIPYILTGGYAISLHGYVRQTFDIDFIVSNDLATLVEVEYALKEIGLLPEKYSAESIYKLKDIETSWVFKNPLDEAEVVDIHVHLNSDSFDTEIKNVQTFKVPILSLEDLIELKSKSEDPKDIADLKVLKEML